MSLLVRLARGNGGATMIIGTWMGLGLIGAIWYMIGVQDAILQRDHAQEAADSIAFSAAVMHARGMNFVASINLVMMALVVVFLLVSVYQEFLHNMLTFVTLWPEPECRTEQLGPCCGQPGVNVAADAFLQHARGEACSIAETTERVHRDAKDIRDRYERNILEPGVLPALGRTERTVQRVVPEGAFLAGAKTGEVGFRTFGFPVALTMVPPQDADAPLPVAGGLPVQSRAFHAMCAKVSGVDVRDWVFDKAGTKIPAFEPLIHTFPFSRVSDITHNFTSGALADHYCPPDDGRAPWRKEGFFTTRTQGSRNGDPVFQIWAFAHQSPSAAATRTHRRVGTGTLLNPVTPLAPPNPTYVAQAEYFFDCSDAWGDAGCNGDDDEGNAAFSMRWKARLKRVQRPNVDGLTLGDVDDYVQRGVAGRAEAAPDYTQDPTLQSIFGATSGGPDDGPSRFFH